MIIDLGEATDIHPKNKLDVGRRLARIALARDYGKQVEHKSPRYESMEKQGDKIVLKFKDVGGGLRTVDAKEVQGFAIAGEDRKWHWADAKIVKPGYGRGFEHGSEGARRRAVCVGRQPGVQFVQCGDTAGDAVSHG